LTLTLQVSVLVAVLALIVFTVQVDDASVFWQPLSALIMDTLRQSNDLQGTIVALEANPDLLARMMTLSVLLATWLSFVVSVMLGHSLFQQLAGNTGRYGRFCDLNFGRVIASALVLMSVLSFLSGVEFIENIAIVLFAIFWLQGLALLHWIRNESRLPTMALAAIYVSHLFLNVVVAIPLAIVGYLDAWFDLRRRIENSKGSKT
jgi:hypothetical protein